MKMFADEFGHGGHLTVSKNYDTGIADVLTQGATELGISANPKYNNGINNGRFLLPITTAHRGKNAP